MGGCQSLTRERGTGDDRVGEETGGLKKSRTGAQCGENGRQGGCERGSPHPQAAQTHNHAHKHTQTHKSHTNNATTHTQSKKEENKTIDKSKRVTTGRHQRGSPALLRLTAAAATVGQRCPGHAGAAGSTGTAASLRGLCIAHRRWEAQSGSSPKELRRWAWAGRCSSMSASPLTRPKTLR